MSVRHIHLKCVNYAQVAITHPSFLPEIASLVTYIYLPHKILVTTCPQNLNYPKMTKIGGWGQYMVQINTPPEAIVSWRAARTGALAMEQQRAT